MFIDKIDENELCPCGNDETYNLCCMNRADTWGNKRTLDGNLRNQIYKAETRIKSELCINWCNHWSKFVRDGLESL